MTGTALARIDFSKAALILKDSDRSLTDVLTELAGPAPIVTDAPTSVMPVAKPVSDEVTKALQDFPELFSAFKPPATRRQLNGKELAVLKDRKKARDILLRELKKQHDDDAEVLSTHFDVKAETEGRAKKNKTSRDPKGHYRLASPGNPERTPIKGGELDWVRERKSDKLIFSDEKLATAYNSNLISRAEYMLVTKAVNTRVCDEDKLRKMLLTVDGRETAQKIIDLIGEMSYGTSSVTLRKSK